MRRLSVSISLLLVTGAEGVLAVGTVGEGPAAARCRDIGVYRRDHCHEERGRNRPRGLHKVCRHRDCHKNLVGAAVIIVVTVAAAAHPSTRVHHVAKIEGLAYQVIREGHTHDAGADQGG